ncbi:MAG TPA: hypothetical protein VK783_14615 [Bacteroidia bacterium]|jgi:hypothetical protein|nr:hypothetical protein [Bacteroidia bacterium]
MRLSFYMQTEMIKVKEVELEISSPISRRGIKGEVEEGWGYKMAKFSPIFILITSMLTGYKFKKCNPTLRLRRILNGVALTNSIEKNVI